MVIKNPTAEDQMVLKEMEEESIRREAYACGYDTAKYSPNRCKKLIKEMPWPRSLYDREFIKGRDAWMKEQEKQRRENLRKIRERSREKYREPER